MKSVSKSLVFQLLTLSALFSTCLWASDGRIEINQTSVEAAGGFPFTIDQPGSYVLTGSLSVPAATNGINILSSDVNLDLNGFQISGPYACITGICPAGTGTGVSATSPIRFVAILNGQVSGFGDQCLEFGGNARIERMLVHDCGENGISVGSFSSVFSNQVINVGGAGIEISGNGTVFAHNTISIFDLNNGDNPAVLGGTPTAGNYCQNNLCKDSRKRYYVTDGGFAGNQALSACAVGFHMASGWELLDITKLRYDGTLGFLPVNLDSEEGPTSNKFGWIRTGTITNTSDLPGWASCDQWTTDDVMTRGTIIYLSPTWDGNTDLGPWEANTANCGNNYPVWCVED